MLEEAASEKQAVIYCHDAYTQCTTVKKVNDFFQGRSKSFTFFHRVKIKSPAGKNKSFIDRKLKLPLT